MKTIKFFSKFTATAFLLGLCSVAASAQGPVVDLNTTSSSLEMSALVETSLQLNISTGTGGATVSGDTATGVFSIDLGNVNGLGNATPAAGVSKAAYVGGTIYSTPINLTPVYSGFGADTASVEVTAGGGANDSIALEGAAANSMVVINGTPKPAFSGALSNSNNERFVGFQVANNETPGDKTAIIIYTVSIDLD